MAATGRGGVLLKYLRVNVKPAALLKPNPNCSGGVFFNALIHRFSSEEVRGTFLDKSEVADRVISVVKKFEKVDPSKVTTNASFQNDLGLDSLDAVEVVMALEEEFGFEIPDKEADKINSINLAVDFIASHPQGYCKGELLAAIGRDVTCLDGRTQKMIENTYKSQNRHVTSLPMAASSSPLQYPFKKHPSSRKK